MITRSSYRQFDETALRLRTADPSDCLFFDIETTGFKPDRSHLYLICLAEKVHDRWKVTQLFGEKPTEEALILRVFAQMIRPYSRIITFNGEQFDIDYLKEKYEAYGIENSLSEKESIDLYRDVRILRRFLRMQHMNQKALEEYLGLHREDPFDGGQLISVYHRYVKTGSQELLDQLLLHNFEDVCGMFAVTALYASRQLFEIEPSEIQVSLRSGSDLPGFSAAGAKISAETGRQTSVETDEQISEETGSARPPRGKALIREVRHLTLSFPLPVAVPVPVDRVSKDFPVRILLQDSACEIHIPVLQGRLLYFLDPVRDYYYLPDEDEAIHKDVAQYVDRQHREKASAGNCYTRQEGFFAPEPSPHFTPVLRRVHKDPIGWFRLPENFEKDPALLADYVMLLLNCVK